MRLINRYSDSGFLEMLQRSEIVASCFIVPVFTMVLMNLALERAQYSLVQSFAWRCAHNPCALCILVKWNFLSPTSPCLRCFQCDMLRYSLGNLFMSASESDQLVEEEHDSPLLVTDRI